jgi:broad specificity phosphatase PhoE
MGDAVVHIYFLRHSESCSNVLGSAASARLNYEDPELTTRGHAMAAERAEEFFRHEAARFGGGARHGEIYICSTPLLRAQQTAQHFAGGGWVDYDEIIVLPYIKNVGLSKSDREGPARLNYNLVPVGGTGPTDVKEFFAWLGGQMKAGHTRLLFVLHKGFLRQLTGWLLGREIEYSNLDGVEVVVRYDGAGRMVGLPRIVGQPVRRYRPSRAVPRDACGRGGSGCRIDVCALRRSRGRKTRKIRK